MDEGNQPLTKNEEEQMQKEQAIKAAEEQTGKTAVPRNLNSNEPEKLNPNFDPDDLRQGKPPPAIKKRKRIHIKRLKGLKGKPLSKEERSKALKKGDGLNNNDNDDEGADLTDEEVDLTEDEDAAIAMGLKDPEEDSGKKKGFLNKILSKD